MSIAYHLGLVGSFAAAVSVSLREELCSLEMCPVTPANCSLLIEMGKILVTNLDRDMNLGLGLSKSEPNTSTSVRDYGWVADMESSSSAQKSREDSMVMEDDSESESDSEDDIHNTYVDRLARVEFAEQPSHTHTDREKDKDKPAWLLPKSPLDASFRSSVGGVGQKSLEEMSASPIQDISFSVLSSTSQHNTRAALAAEVGSILKDVSYQDEDQSLLTVDDLPVYYHRTDVQNKAGGAVYVDRRDHDREQFDLIKSGTAIGSSSSSSSNSNHRDELLESAARALSRPDSTENAAETKEEDGEGSTGSGSDIDSVNIEDLMRDTNRRLKARSVSFDETASNADDDNSDHEQLHSPRFNPPLSPRPYHSDEDVPNGHTHYLTSPSSSTIVVKALEAWSASSAQPSEELEKYQSQVRLRAQLERELMKRGNHVAFETDLGVADDYIEGGNEGVAEEDVPVRLSEEDQERWRGEDEDELENESSHIHPASHPAFGSPPLRADGTLDLTSNSTLNGLLTESLRNVIESYTGETSRTGLSPPKNALKERERERGSETDGAFDKSVFELERRRSSAERVRTSVLSHYEALSGRDSGSELEVEEESHKGFRDGIYFQYDRYTKRGDAGDDHLPGRETPAAATATGAQKQVLLPHKHKDLHVHIKEDEVEEIPIRSSFSSSNGKKIKEKTAGYIYEELGAGKKKKSPKNGAEKPKARRKKKKQKPADSDVEQRALHAPKHVTEKFIDVRASQDFRTGIYRSGSSSLPPSPPPHTRVRGCFSRPASVSPQRVRTPLSSRSISPSKMWTVPSPIPTPSLSPAPVKQIQRGKSQSQGQQGQLPVTAMRARALSAKASSRTVSVPSMSVSASQTTSTSASRREGDREGERVGGKRLLEFFAPKVQNMRKSLSVHIPTAAATAATARTQVTLPPDCDRERVLRRSEGKTDLELKGNSGEASLWHLDTSPRSILRKGWTPENLSQSERSAIDGNLSRSPGRDLVRRSSPYSAAKVSRSRSPVLRTKARSIDEVEAEGQSEEVGDTDDEATKGDESRNSSASQSTPSSLRLRPRSAKGRRRSSECVSPIQSPPSIPLSGDESYPEEEEDEEEEEAEKEEQHEEEEDVDMENVKGQDSADADRLPLAISTTPNSSSFSPSVQRKKAPQSDADPLLSFSSLHFSRDAAFSQSLREAIRQSVEGSFRRLLGPSFRTILLGQGSGLGVQATVPGNGKSKKKKAKSSSSSTSALKTSSRGSEMHFEIDPVPAPSMEFEDPSACSPIQDRIHKMRRALGEGEDAMDDLDGLPPHHTHAQDTLSSTGTKAKVASQYRDIRTLPSGAKRRTQTQNRPPRPLPVTAPKPQPRSTFGISESRSKSPVKPEKKFKGKAASKERTKTKKVVAPSK
jgi:hypothetical protein